MQLTIRTVGILMLMLCISATQVQAQFLKNLFKDGAGKKSGQHKKAHKALTSDNYKQQGFDYPNSKVKEHYRIDVLADLYLDELVKEDKPTYKGKAPDKAVAGLDFYKGIKLAADSLSKLNYQIDVYVHDVSEAHKSVGELISNKKLESADLIIGVLQSADLEVVAKYAQKRHIHFVSALSPSDAGISDNPYFTILQPTLRSHCEWIRERIASKHAERKVVVYSHSHEVVDAMTYGYVTDGYEELFRKLSCNKLPRMEKMKAAFDSEHPNVLIMPILDASYADSLLQELTDSFPKYKFIVYGMPSWKGMPSLRKENAHPNVVVYLTSPFYFDTKSATSQYLVSHCRKIFGSKPGEMVYRGFETMMWYGIKLHKYGTIFDEGKGTGIFTQFKIQPRWDKEQYPLYMENLNLFLLKYEKGGYVLE